MSAVPAALPEAADLERRLLDQFVAIVFLGGLGTALGWLVLPRGTESHDGPLLAVILAAGIIGVVLLTGRLRAGRGLLGTAIAVSNLLAAGAIYLTGVADSGLEIFFVWLSPFAYAFTPLRTALLQTVLAATAYAGALVALGAPAEATGRWLLVTASIVAVGVLTRRLSGSVRETDARFRRAFESSAAGMALVDRQGRAVAVNGALCEILGRGREDLLGRCPGELVHPDDRQLRGRCAPGAGHGLELRILRPDGTAVWVHTESSPVHGAGRGVEHFLCQVSDISERKAAEGERRAHGRLLEQRVRELELVAEVASSALAGARLPELAQRSRDDLSGLEDGDGRTREAVDRVLALASERFEAQESIAQLARQRGRLVADALAAEEAIRTSISEALHERALQEMLAVRQDIVEARRHPDRRDEALERAQRGLAAAGAELRTAVFELHPLALGRGGLRESLESMAWRQHERGAIGAWQVAVDPQAECAHDALLLSVARELITNVAKHAGAALMQVEVRHRGAEVELSVLDDGRGMTAGRPAEALRERHIGLASSAQRVEAVGGRFTVESEPGRGTAVRLRVPRSST